jgi:hypothetical protein
LSAAQPQRLSGWLIGIAIAVAGAAMVWLVGTLRIDRAKVEAVRMQREGSLT